MAWCWELGFIPGCCRWSNTAEYRGIRLGMGVGMVGGVRAGFFGVGAFYIYQAFTNNSNKNYIVTFNILLTGYNLPVHRQLCFQCAKQSNKRV
jgi:hypothetical protein